MSEIYPFPREFVTAEGGQGAQPKSVCVIGLGYIGLPTAAVLAERGYHVTGVDVHPHIVETINGGRIHIHEPGLGELVNKVVKSGNLKASLKPVESDVFFICVPTPANQDKSPDLSYVRAACEAIRPCVRAGNLVILESTSPPKTTEGVVVAQAIPSDLQVGENVFVAYCPERVLPGRILTEVIENDRIVGGVTAECTHRAKGFYETVVTGEVLSATAIDAELSKLVENSFRDVNIAFANELSMLADQFGADPFEVIELANRHPRVNILTPGPGVGGHCISVDPWFLVHAAPEQTPLIRTARQVNGRKPQFVVEQVETMVRDHDISVVGCLGLAYKADVDDLRESPSLEIVRDLYRRLDSEILVCDPFVSVDKFTEFPLHGFDEVISRSEMLVLLTGHSQFVKVDADNLSDKLILDARGKWGTSKESVVKESLEVDAAQATDKRAA